MKNLKLMVAAMTAGSMLVGATLVAQTGGAGAAAPAPAGAAGAPAPAAAPATAPAVDPGKVVLSVGELTMTAGDFEALVAGLPPEVQMMARGPQKRRIGEDLLKLKILASEARKRKLDQSPQFRQQMELMRDNALAGLLSQELLKTLVTEEDVKKAYEARKGEFEQVTARHILVQVGGETALTDEAAKKKADDLKKQIDGGGNFAELAKANSADPGSKDEGGLMPPFRRGRMVPEFDQKAFELKPGQVSEPVKTRFGYHIIKVEKKDVPPIEEVREELEDQIRPQKLEAYLAELRKTSDAKLDESFFGPAAPAPGPQPAPGAPAPAPDRLDR